MIWFQDFGTEYWKFFELVSGSPGLYGDWLRSRDYSLRVLLYVIMSQGFSVEWKKKRFMAMKGPRGALFYMGSIFGPFYVLLLKK